MRLVILSGAVGRPPGWEEYGSPGSTAPSVTGGAALIEFDEALCPDLGFDCRAIEDVSGQFVYTLLDQIAQDGAGLGVKVAFGVRPDRKFFCQPARTDVVTPPAADLIHVEWKTPQAEAPVTVVIWYVAKRPNGTWVKHTSQSPQAHLYGLRAKPLTLDASAVPWVPVPCTYRVAGGEFLNGSVAALTDGRLYRDGTPINAANYVQYTDGRDFVLSLVPSSPYARVVLDGNTSGQPLTLYAGGVSLPLGTLTAGERTFQVDGAGEVTLSAPGVTGGTLGSILSLYEFRVDRVDTALLDRMAEHHYSLPASEPADIELRGFRSLASLGGRIRLNDYERAVEVWEYRLTDERGVTMGVLTGQADDPLKLAQAALLKRQNANTVITAVTATG